MSKLDEVREFDQQTAVLALECFKELCDLACAQFPSNLENFLRETCNKEFYTSIINQLIKNHKPFFFSLNFE